MLGMMKIGPLQPSLATIMQNVMFMSCEAGMGIRYVHCAGCMHILHLMGPLHWSEA